MVDTLLAAKGSFALVPAGPEDMRLGLDIEFDHEDIGLRNIGLRNMVLRNIVPGPSAAEAVRPGSALAGLYIHPEGPYDCCTRHQAAGNTLALPLLLKSCQPPHFSLAHPLWELVLKWYQICGI